MSLRDRLVRQIQAKGTLSVADYMTLCLHDPVDGYYATCPRLGEGGDFLTAPHISQMFGELIGLWVAQAWTDLGSPGRFVLVELGPGEGLLIGDMLRALRVAPHCLAAAELWLVESSAALRERQAAVLAPGLASWANDLAEVPADLPTIIVANEFLDCLPIRQWISDGAGITERRIGLSPAGDLVFLPDRAGDILESSEALVQLGAAVGRRLASHGGAALFIDYGRDAPGPGDTLQALRRHVREHPLASPGEADLTAHVDFPAFLAATGTPHELTSQGEFLRKLGIEARAAALVRARADQAAILERQCDRLIAPDAMGLLFKVANLRAQPPAMRSA